tara:strand:+ start:462 stop:707 length:246 start_codon:yes stop_codon:yes gene_type:complete
LWVDFGILETRIRQLYFVVIITSILLFYSLIFLGTDKETEDEEKRLYTTSLAKTFHIPMKIKEIMFFFFSFWQQEIICYLK